MAMPNPISVTDDLLKEMWTQLEVVKADLAEIKSDVAAMRADGAATRSSAETMETRLTSIDTQLAAGIDVSVVDGGGLL